MAFMTYGEDIFGEEKNEEIGDKLLETDWLEMDNNLLEEVKAEWLDMLNQWYCMNYFLLTNIFSSVDIRWK